MLLYCLARFVSIALLVLVDPVEVITNVNTLFLYDCSACVQMFIILQKT